MKNATKIVSTLILGSMLSLAACGKKDAAKAEAPKEPAKTESAAEPAAADPAAAQPKAEEKPKAEGGGW